jgi:hypothetical protein
MYQPEKIEAYLRKELSAEESLAFENMMQRDPLLNNEVHLQNEIAEALQIYRKNQLKARFNQLSPDTGFTMSEGYKAMGIAASAVIVGVLLYLYLQQSSPSLQNTDNTESKVTVPQTKESIYVSKPESVQTPLQARKEPLEADRRTQHPAKTHPQPESQSHSSQPVSPQVDDQMDTSGETLLKQDNLSLPSGDLSPAATKERPTVKIAIINEKKSKYQFHYTFTEGRLTLYGPFREVYEILDFYTSSGKQLYLYYQDRFYLIKENQIDVARLEQVHNPKLIKTLQQARIAQN